MTAKIMILALLSGFWLLNTFNSAPHDFSYHDCLLLSVLFLSIMGVQAAIIVLCRRLLNHKKANVVLSVFFVVNLFTFYLIFYTPFTRLAAYLWWLILVGSVWGAYKFWVLLDTETKTKKIVLTVASLLFGYAGINAVIEKTKTIELPASFISTTHGMTSSPFIRLVEFEKKPNVYFLSFDSLIPRSLAKQHLGINDLPYQDYMEQEDFRMFRNLFADAVLTRKSLGNFLSLGINRFASKKAEVYGGFFTGLIPSPMLEIFKANGYTTNTYHHSHYFGPPNGKYVDNYRIMFPFTACFYLTDNAYIYGLWGFCWFVSWVAANNWGGVTEHIQVYDDIQHIRFFNFFQQEVSHALSTQSRSVFLSYTWQPGHVPHGYNHTPKEISDYKESFMDKSAKTAKHMEDIMTFIRENDPNALVFIFGDHGTLISEHLGYEWENFSEEEKQFFIRDRYGILGGVYPKDACDDYFEHPFSQKYTTLAQVGRQIILCLSNGQDPLISPINYRLEYDKWGYRGKKSARYEDYVYE